MHSSFFCHERTLLDFLKCIIRTRLLHISLRSIHTSFCYLARATLMSLRAVLYSTARRPCPPSIMTTSSQRLKKALKTAALLPARAVMGSSSSLSHFSRALQAYTPAQGETPIVILRLQVVGCTGLMSKDRNGLTDPYVCPSPGDLTFFLSYLSALSSSRSSTPGGAPQPANVRSTPPLPLANLLLISPSI